MRTLSIAAVSLGLLLVTAGLRAATINTVPDWDGSTGICCFGIPDSQTFGQTVTVPVGLPVLQSFAFEMKLPTALVFRGEVYAWDGAQATGPNLYESGGTSTTSGVDGFDLITFNTGGITLVQGAQYVLFASTSKDNAGHESDGNGSWGEPEQDDYAGGNWVFLNNGNDPALWTTTPWGPPPFFLGIGGDLAFQADFAPGPPPAVPEQSTMVLIASGLVGLTFAARRKNLL